MSDTPTAEESDRQRLITEVATRAMFGNYLGIIPRDSIFFFSEGSIRADILGADSYIAAVSISRKNLTEIYIKPDVRVPIARWCGDATRFNLENSDLRLNLVADCYVFDASGVIFSAVSSTTPSINTFILYSTLVGDTLEPLNATIVNIEKIPTAFDFARQVSQFGSPVKSVIIREDEVDNSLSNGTRITYVLGKEKEAFTALVSARDKFNLADGSIEYIDLRFDGKVYVKRR